MDYFEDLLKKPSLFKDEGKLDIHFTPLTIPYREKELSLLSQLFLELIINPNSISRKILIIGKSGAGKTAIIKLFGKMLVNAAQKRSAEIKYVHINCRKEKTSLYVLLKIARTLNNTLPEREYTPQDLLEIIVNKIKDQNLHLLIVLDELSYIIRKEKDLIYSLTNINDDSFNSPHYVSIIGIARDISCLDGLDTSTMSTLQRNIIYFNNYNKEQLFDILKYRTEISLKENVISDKLLQIIADITYENGDIRYGLNILWKSTKIAENQNLKYVTAESIRFANHDIIPFSTLDILKYMHIQKIIFLLAIINYLEKSGEIDASMTEITESYFMLCENLGIQPRSHSQLWNYLQEFKRECLITMKIVSESIKGRKTHISVQDIPISKMQELLIERMDSEGIKI